MRKITCLVGSKYTEEMNKSLNPDITYRGEIKKLPGVWNKLAMLTLEGEYFYIDIDTKIREYIPDINYDPDKLNVLSAYWKRDNPKYLIKHKYNTIINSSVMIWTRPQTEIYEHFLSNKDYYMRKYKGIDRYLFWEHREKLNLLPDGLVSSNANPWHEKTPLLTFNGEDYGQYFKSN